MWMQFWMWCAASQWRKQTAWDCGVEQKRRQALTLLSCRRSNPLSLPETPPSTRNLTGGGTFHNCGKSCWPHIVPLCDKNPSLGSSLNASLVRSSSKKEQNVFLLSAVLMRRPALTLKTHFNAAPAFVIRVIVLWRRHRHVIGTVDIQTFYDFLAHLGPWQSILDLGKNSWQNNVHSRSSNSLWLEFVTVLHGLHWHHSSFANCCFQGKKCQNEDGILFRRGFDAYTVFWRQNTDGWIECGLLK